MKNQRIWKFSLMLAVAIALMPSALQAEYKPVKYVRDSLENGLQIIYSIDKSAPVVATVLHYKVGSRDENPAKTGYAHLFEHLMFEATDNIPRASIDKYALDAAGQLNASTSFDQTVYHFKVPSNEIKLPLWIESQRMRRLHVDSVGVGTQRGVVIEELKMRSDNQPYGKWMQLMMENLFPGTGYGWSVGGHKEHVAAAQISDFKGFYDNFYQPNNAVLVICGDFNIKDAKQYVRDYFNQYPKAPEPKRNPMNLGPLEKSHTSIVEDAMAPLPAVFIGYRGPRMGHPDYYAMAMLTDILAAGESSRLYQSLVAEKQISMQAHAMPFSLEKAGAIIFIAVGKPGTDIKKIEEEIYKEIQKIIEDGVTEEEFQKAKNIKEAEFISSKKQVLAKASSLAEYTAYYDDPELINDEIEDFKAVTREEIQRIAKKYFSVDKKVSITFVPKNKN
jgi:zinc protease